MEPNFRAIEKKWQQTWKDEKRYKTNIDLSKPKYYVLDMFPYPSGAGLHVGHPLGYIASDIVSRYKRLKGFNVLHPMGFDAFGLPAEQYAIQTGRHPADTTAENIARYKEQLGNIGFCYDWDREVITSDPNYHKWTQWIFLQLFGCWFNLESQKAEDISKLEALFSQGGSTAAKGACGEHAPFSAAEWNAMNEADQRGILMHYRLAYQDFSTVNWCEALGTVLANDEVKDGLSERGGHPVEKRRMRQWFLRITAYAERLLNDLETLEWTDSMKEMQRNWIGKSEGASIRFEVASDDLTPGPSPRERGGDSSNESTQERGMDSGYVSEPGVEYHHANSSQWKLLIPRAKEMRSNMTESEKALWEELRNSAIGLKFRRQHIIDQFIVDFVCLSKMLVVEIDGKIHDNQKEYDEGRTAELNRLGFEVIRFENAELAENLVNVVDKIKSICESRPTNTVGNEAISIAEESQEEYTASLPSPRGEGPGVRSKHFIEVFTTRPDTIFGVSFLTLAPEHELVSVITTDAQRDAVNAYVEVAKNRSERERMADVKRISGEFTGAYVLHPFTGAKIPVWVGDYVLAGYGTGAVMAVPAGDQRDWDFAKHFNLPIPEINEGVDISEAANPTKEAKMINSDFLNGLTGYEALKKAIGVIEERGFGKGKVNYRLRDAGFSRQRYWGEPFPIVYRDGVAYPLAENELPLELPVMADFKPTGQPESPLTKVPEWVNVPDGTRETDTMPGYAGSSWYFLRYMDPQNKARFVGREAEEYWQDVDLYIGGTEHAVGHLLYARFWQKFLFDRGEVSKNEPFRKLINQGMILGQSAKIKLRKANDTLIIVPSNDETFNLINSTIEDNFPIELLRTETFKNNLKYCLTENILKTSSKQFEKIKQWKWPNQIEIECLIDSKIKELIILINIDNLLTKVDNLIQHKNYYTTILELEELRNNDNFLSLFSKPDNELIALDYSVSNKTFIEFYIYDLNNNFIAIPQKLDTLIRCIEFKSSFKDKIKIPNKNCFNSFDFKASIQNEKAYSNYTWPNKKSINSIIEIETEKLAEVVIEDSKTSLKSNPSNVKYFNQMCELILLRRKLRNEPNIFKIDKILLDIEVEKMSKSKYNVVNPDDIINDYGADTLRLYEMFLGPLEQFKPWNTNGIEGVYRFLKKLWNLYFDENGQVKLSDEAPTEGELRTLHKTIRKVEEDIEKFSFNTSVSVFMICVNELSEQKCRKRAILQDLSVIIAPYAPHMAEELWQACGGSGSVVDAQFPQWNENFIKESSIAYPVAFNGKVRYQIQVAADMPQAEVQALALSHEDAAKWLPEGGPKKVIVVPGRMVNVVI